MRSIHMNGLTQPEGNLSAQGTKLLQFKQKTIVMKDLGPPERLEIKG